MNQPAHGYDGDHGGRLSSRPARPLSVVSEPAPLRAELSARLAVIGFTLAACTAVSVMLSALLVPG